MKFWGLLPSGARVEVRPRKDQVYRYLVAFRDGDGDTVWWGHAFHETRQQAEASAAELVRQRRIRLRRKKLSHMESAYGPAEILPAYFEDLIKCSDALP